MKRKMKTIQSKSHHLKKYEINKIYLSCFDYKHHILEDQVNALAYDHKDIKN